MHTPGPWKVINGTVYLGEAHDRVQDERLCIAKMAREPKHHIPPTERDANARLIAAAPELLAACESILLAWDGGDLAYAARQCAAAVNKAKGA
jgi:hypothetical protein